MIRKMKENDVGMVLLWRNNPDIRKHMYTQHIIGKEEHNKWFKKMFNDPSINLLIFEKNHKPMGFIQINSKIPSYTTWGFYLAPESPKGTGAQLGANALEYAFKNLKIDRIHGEVIKSNTQSIAFHKKLGFELDDKYDDVYIFRLNIFDWKDITINKNS